MKALLFTVATLFSITAMADQCQMVSRAEAERALLLIQPGSTVSTFCELCGDTKPTRTEVVSSVSAAITDGTSVVSINGESVDLAYLYLKVAPNKKVNVALAVGCETLDASTVSSVIK